MDSELYTGRVQHNTDLSADGLGGKISSESASDDSVGTVRAADLAPVHSVFVSVFIGDVPFRDEGDSLSEVEVGLLLRIDSLNFDKAHVVVLRAEGALVSEDGTINVETRSSLF
mmetsp:Transcript_21601/g.51543  ORF Transcript_21601/g.51543 Transcript_21601/m.51543 type:complete len:114 (+) Transcript_21601:222-563(+)